ncbi:MAG: hypothetical protein F6K50_10880 [Moorea sp. SIO3I7]|nr:MULTISPECIES: hypothetical protein [unclassified Moorena]NEN96011.1 hypothetical protein [Moorena sp. SIO3I7]NEO05517.1 hypothetical protein [Moorena sp. SIO3I8]NEP24135.1 hypothetical protein [Moorena sp. SIO3I6]
MGETTAVAHGGDHGSRSWLEVTVRQLSLVLMQSASGGNPQDRANHANQ